ncbi:AAA family ATPase [Treponema phagedenis]|uniref:AAA family ATPase n=1 Tax=Treponema phagedenis TaxID=162 RepID=A0AAE6IW24_TREPH|nr:AAA family ATPase [Treponema phagedenis]QEJ98277.1 AAA family ATPase [Treponema phagedenis]
MTYTKEEVLKNITAVIKTFNDARVNPSSILSKLSYSQKEQTEICNLFNVNRMVDVLKFVPNLKYTKNKHGTTFVGFETNENENNLIQETNTTMEEKTMEKKHDRIETLLKELGKDLYEKDEALRLALLTAIAGESIFFLGAPGCAKSMIARRMLKAFKADGDGSVKYFETLLNQFTTPDEVFGNVSLKALNGELPEQKGKEEYRRLTKNMLPEADIAFLDEIWKASPAILNTLLTIINERKFHNGNKIMDVPLKTIFTASNELPAKNRGLEALYDRLILRLQLDFIENEDNFFEMISGANFCEFELSDEAKKKQISNDELKNWKIQIDKITLSPEARAVISAIRKELTLRNAAMSDEEKEKGEQFQVGDRRWKKITHILKTSAFLNDRTEIDLMDCQLIEYCIWNTEKQQKKAREIVEKCIQQNGLDCDTAIEEINEEIEEFKTRVDETWFEETLPVKYKMKDDVSAYKILNPKEIYFADQKVVPYYISDSYKWSGYNDRMGMLYDAKGEALGLNYNFAFNNCSVSNDKITWTDWWRSYNSLPERKHTMTIETSIKQKECSDIAQETLQKNFDKKHYAPIVKAINAEIEKIKTKKENDAIPFKANLFADQAFNTSIVSKLDEAIHTFEDAKINLDKQHARYFNAELQAKFSVGDVILKDGVVLSSDEIKNISENEKASVIAVICVDGEKPFAISIVEGKKNWTALDDFLHEHKTTLTDEYAENWIIPQATELEEIWDNREKINASLKAAGKPELTTQEYWSSEEKGDGAAVYQMFDEEGHQDHTTKDHEYAIRAIRYWTKD